MSARHWPDLIKECPRTEKGEKKLTPREPQEVKWIRQMTSQTPSQEFQPVLPDLDGKPLFTTHDSGETLQRRCGRAFQNAYTADRQHLFLEMLYNHHQGISKGISSFYVRQSVWFAFFEPILPSQIASNVLISDPFRSLIDAGHLEELHGIFAVASTSQATAGYVQNSGSQPEKMEALRDVNKHLEELELQNREYFRQLEESRACSTDLQGKISCLQLKIGDEDAKANNMLLNLRSREESLNAEKNQLLVKFTELENKLKYMEAGNDELQRQLAQLRQIMLETQNDAKVRMCL
ncbi:hypothetical protein K469DRAFT_686389 [Zopfia rhizophila CBS 207.26]|uniref:Uncharacterized protein n=1 Tax=Zopfia rhizophila CBS 207.26 TaxID=1314779 RepID=A0A6A6E5K3_9PEZI|nr:hypothetical protein K469DRAFT_686389 [Zopfia rhizophila CBS 207.26]